MNFFKKEWKTIVLALCLIVTFIYIVQIDGQIKDLQQQNARIISTFDSIESVTISSDAGLNEISKKIEKIENNVAYIVKKVRRR